MNDQEYIKALERQYEEMKKIAEDAIRELNECNARSLEVNQSIIKESK